MNKTYKIPKWHELYSDYFRYLNNLNETIRIMTKFRNKHDIKCEWFKAGVKESNQVPYLHIGTRVDVNRIIADKNKFGTDILKPNKDGMYPVRRNSKLFNDWLETLKYEDNFKILDEPKISKYIAIDNNGKDLGTFEREFLINNGSLYVYITSNNDFIVTDDFIEIENYKFFEMKEGIKSE